MTFIRGNKDGEKRGIAPLRVVYPRAHVLQEKSELTGE
jgi:hypothetical protein